MKVMLVAAEASGDALGAGLASAIKARNPGVELVGIGGPRLAEQGIVSPFDIAELSVLGWLEGLRAYGRVKARVADTVAMAVRERPDAVVLIDSWGFTIRVAKAIRAALPNVKLVKYVGPQVWASRPGRAKTLAAAVDHLLALYAFDAPWFEAEGLPTTVVGSQALHVDMTASDPVTFRAARGIALDAPLLLILPGSRPGEIRLMTPVYEAAAARLKAERPDLQIAVVAAGTVAADVTARVAAWPFRAHLVTETDKYAAMKAATVALATSGTVSTELALAGVPMVIGYRFAPVSYAIMKPFFTGKYATLFNHAADAEIARELIQTDATPDRFAAELARLLDDPAARADQSARQTAALDRMGREGRDPSEIAADTVLSLLDGVSASPRTGS
ncbi:lipid-A-disaccharide synthase [Brevundimonas subvibrioides]|uniref:Lipid-A-disaccharide synthase n=1 Tax=Brevundimonas subvibrioides (strain ATCC 15264 / DSM 4735 / LMG 14903 / NBRC 16000 / CB 81) TaxID=633149 RepID=D9QKY0_BRESC|nr:lipid-A-disaccharide synthase [Brevundimonas subvibrioides]ADL01794.1 lipid-A-disaccharide synthase [Brevundimonas subvibrioides ATCC 15264]